MQQLIDFIVKNKELLIYISIPFTCAFVGWFTNLVAIKMTFYPLKFWGIPPYLGWQGIIPSKAKKMSAKAVDMLTKKLIKVEEIFEHVEPQVMAQEMSPPVLETTDTLVNDIALSSNPTIWNMVPEAIKSSATNRVKAEIPNIVTDVVKDIKRDILIAFDLKSHVTTNLTGDNVHLLVELFQRAGGPEFKFIERSGIYFGLLFGLVQMTIWYVYNSSWTLPVFGAVVGYLTNWLALKMIFRPLREKRYLFIKYQGLFLRRQKEVSKEYAHFISTKILSPKKILNAILYGKTAEKIISISQKHLLKSLSTFEGLAKPVASMLMGKEEYESVKRYIVSKMTAMIPASAMRVEKYLGEQMNLEETLYERMSKLPPEEFEELLRTAFQEDEIILILVGAFLGFLVGLAQAFLFK